MISSRIAKLVEPALVKVLVIFDLKGLFIHACRVYSKTFVLLVPMKTCVRNRAK